MHPEPSLSAERVGFEPTGEFLPTAFRERHHQPLGHLSLAIFESEIAVLSPPLLDITSFC